jgi:hypothetical protein
MTYALVKACSAAEEKAASVSKRSSPYEYSKHGRARASTAPTMEMPSAMQWKKTWKASETSPREPIATP